MPSRSRRGSRYERKQHADEEAFAQGVWPFGCSGGLEDVPVPAGAACKAISALLGKTEADAGEYSFGGPAEGVPAVPGLLVDGVGAIPVPLRPEVAEKLVARCEKSPFGRKLDTMMDESVRKSWQLGPESVTLTNPAWHEGVQKLSTTIASRLGYKGIPLQCVLYKLLVYGEGGHFVKHQDTEKEDGMVATLVIQPPSLHAGGDLVVYRGREAQYRHDFGKVEGSAAFEPHYAVHYADAQHALEAVSSGYRLALVYSICLPPAMRHLMKSQSDKPLAEELAEAIKRVGREGESFALLLSHEYTEKSIGGMGSRALKGVDRARFQALEEATTLLPDDQKLYYYIAQLKHEINYEGGQGAEHGQEPRRGESISWHTLSGASSGHSKNSALKLNFLNPGQESLSELWHAHGSSTFEGYLGNEGAIKSTTYSRYAIVAFSGATAVENTLKYIGKDAAADALKSQRPVSASTLRGFMNSARLELAKKSSGHGSYDCGSVSATFCQSLCELLVEAGDASLVELFLQDFFGRVEKKSELSSSVAMLARGFNWGDVGQALLNAMGGSADHLCSSFGGNSLGEAVHDSSLELLLRVVDELEQGPAQGALLRLAMEQATHLRDDLLSGSQCLGLLWKWALRCETQGILDMVVAHVKRMDPSLLGPVIKGFSSYAASIDIGHDKFAAFASIVAARLDWLNVQLQELGKPFTWEMPQALFPDNAHVQAFLRGPKSSMTTAGVRSFNGVKHARNYAAKWMRNKQINASFEMKAGGYGGQAFVTISKTRTRFAERQKELAAFKAEAARLMQRYGARLHKLASRKRAREEDVIAIE